MRRKNALKNIKISFIFYIITVISSFISRSFFIKILGASISGFNNLIMSLLGFLNIAELGISMAITYALYTPLRNKDYKKLNEIMILFKYYYIRTGMFILFSGVILSLFLQYFVKGEINLRDTYLYYYLFLINSAISYFFCYKEALISADQKQYIVTIINQTSKLIKTIIQILVLIYTQSYTIWIIIELIFTIINFILISKTCSKLYPYISYKSNENIKEIKRKNNYIIRSIKDVFFHKIATFIVNQTDSILISLFLTLKQTAIYGNYMMIVNNVVALISSVMNSFKGSVGDLVAENNKEKTYLIFEQLYIIDNMLGIIITCILYRVINKFIMIWVGKEYLFNSSIVLIILINLYIQISRNTVEKFKESYGIFWDTWAPVLEGIINLSVSLLLINHMGIIGLFIGTFASNVTIVLLWKPYVLYKYGLENPFIKYFKIFSSILIKNALIIIVSNYLINNLIINIALTSSTIIDFIIECILFSITISVTTVIIFLFNRSFRELVIGCIGKRT